MKGFIAAGALAALAVAAVPAAASTPAPSTNGGVVFGSAPPPTAPAKAPVPKPAKPRSRPVLSAFSVTPGVLSPGATPSVTFRVTSSSPAVRLRLVVSWPDTQTPSRVIDLGHQTTGPPHTLELPGLADATLPEGVVSVRIAGRDSAGGVLVPAAKLSRVQQIQVRAHLFPLRGSFSYGGPDARYGATRTGHIHQGQDLMAAEGTPVVAIRGGTIAYSQYQAAGAGYYLVLHADGEDYDYAYMHLQEGSILVKQGDHVEAGQPLAGVGHTGDAQGDHLHFEVWLGAWFAGGHTVDPLPFLQQWQTWSDAHSLDAVTQAKR
jgi:hypothetical protein